jgi:DNA-binding transcriptional MerR regulator
MPTATKPSDHRRLTFEQLEAQSGVPDRTLRRWMRIGLLPGPRGASRASYYDATHVVRARAIEALRGQRLSIRAIRDRLSVMSAQELKRLGEPQANAAESAPAAPAAPSYPSSTWEVVELSEALVLLVRADREGARRLADEIYRHYRA